MLYIVTYNAAREKEGELIKYFEDVRNAKLTPVSKQIEESWTVDLGDDPSFLAYSIYKKQGGKLSWGICRPDIRRNLDSKVPNTIVFIAHTSDDNTRQHQYRLTAICSVDSIISQWDIANDPTCIYNNYANMLLRPGTKSGTYIHKEWYEEVTCDSTTRHHHNWLWRLGKIPKSKGDTEEGLIKPINEKYDRKISKKIINHLPFTLDDIKRIVEFDAMPTYVLFSSTDSFIISNPPIIATFHDNIPHDIVRDNNGYEQWEQSSLATTIYDQLFGATMQNHSKYPIGTNLRLRRVPFDGIKLSRGGFMHRHHRFELRDEILWRNNFIDAINGFPDEIHRAKWL